VNCSPILTGIENVIFVSCFCDCFHICGYVFINISFLSLLRVMIGRALIEDPFLFARVDQHTSSPSREEVAKTYAAWLEEVGMKLRVIVCLFVFCIDYQKSFNE
jgi:hypothetical protein